MPAIDLNKVAAAPAPAILMNEDGSDGEAGGPKLIQGEHKKEAKVEAE